MRPAKRFKIGLLVAVIAFAIIVGPRLAVHAAYSGVRFETPAEVPSDEAPRIALVFGAGLSAGGSRPSIVLYDRVATAVELYHAGRASKLLMSGDNRFVEYNEPEVMRETAVALGVPEKDIVLDYAGRRTYDSCYRAKEIFGVERAVLVTQSFHLDRALYLCNSMGVDAIGVAADRHPYADRAHRWWHLREIPAVLSAWFDLNVRHPIPVMGEKLPIDPAASVDEAAVESGEAVAAQEAPEPAGNVNRPEAVNAADSTANANGARVRGSH
ncbi:MAG: ElyC/SanA/YdcF family protein [Blastocatellia bacterium]